MVNMTIGGDTYISGGGERWRGRGKEKELTISWLIMAVKGDAQEAVKAHHSPKAQTARAQQLAKA